MDAARTGNEDRFVDVDYRSFVSDPMGVACSLYSAMGIELTNETEHAMRRWSEERPKDRFGAHRYAAEDFGLSEGVIRERMSDYVEHYGLAADG